MSKLNEIGRKNPFKVPEGYFEQFPEDFMSRLPERTTEEPKALNLWDRLKPWIYMAAMFAGIALIVRIFVGIPVQTQDSAHAPSSAEIEIIPEELEDFYTYYRDQAAQEICDEVLFLELGSEDTEF